MNWAGVGILAIKAGTALVIFGAPLVTAYAWLVSAI